MSPADHKGTQRGSLVCWAQVQKLHVPQHQKDHLKHSAQTMPDAITKFNEATANEKKIITEKVGAHKAAESVFQELASSSTAIEECKKALLAQRSGIATVVIFSL